MWGTSGDNQPSFYTLYVDRPVTEHTYLSEERGNIKGLLSCWNKDGNAAKKEDGRLFLHAFHGQCEKKGIGDVL